MMAIFCRHDPADEVIWRMIGKTAARRTLKIVAALAIAGWLKLIDALSAVDGLLDQYEIY